MDPRSYSTIMSYYQSRWLADILGFEVSNGRGGIDTFGDKVCVELKNRLRDWNHSWPVMADEIPKFPRENPGKTLYWAFLLYSATKTIPSIRNRDLPRVLVNREVWFFDWDWIDQFPVSHAKNEDWVYVRKKAHFPPNNTFVRRKRKGGVLYLPKNSALEELL